MNDSTIHWELWLAITVLGALMAVISALGTWIFRRIVSDIRGKASRTELENIAQRLEDHLDEDTAKFQQLGSDIEGRHRDNQGLMREIKDTIIRTTREASEDRRLVANDVKTLIGQVGTLKGEVEGLKAKSGKK